MPNWCEGNLRIRGTVQQLAEFVKNAVDADDVTKYLLTDTKINVYLKNGATWLRGSERAFVMGSIEAYANSPKQKKSVALDYRSAWRVESNVLLDLAVKTGVDIRLYAYERGAEFNRNIEIIGGKMVKDETISFDDYRRCTRWISTMYRAAQLL